MSPSSPSRIIFITQALDPDDPVLAVAVSWVSAFAAHPAVSSLHVVALRAAPHPPISGVTVSRIRARTRIGTMFNFYRAVIPRLFSVDAFFVHMDGPYPLWLLPFRLLFRIPVYQWRTHRHAGHMTWFYARFCDTRVFTASPQSFPYRLPSVRVVGHGIDTDLFSPLTPSFSGADLLMIGRVAPVKRIELALSAFADFHRSALHSRLDLYGPVFPQDAAYRAGLLRLAHSSGISPSVSFHGPVSQRFLPDIIRRHRAVVSCNDGGLDKAVLEAFSCGVPVVTDNPCVAEILPPPLRSVCIVPRGDIPAYAAALRSIFALDSASYRALGDSLRSVVVSDHSVVTLIDRFLREMGFGFPR